MAAAEVHSIPAKPAATVMLLRDAGTGQDTEEGIEVFMLRRTTAAAFAGGMYVFPGGKVDAADGQGDLGYVIAAIRECYEEAGVLLATNEAGEMVIDGHPALEHRHAVHAGDVDLRALCEHHQLRPAVDGLVWTSHWITPIGESSRRFDTRFFVAVAPLGQTSRHDDNETIASVWVSPADALSRQARGELTMMLPTIKNLEFLDAHRNASSVMESARQLGKPVAILPRLRSDATGRVRGVSLPDDDDYADLG
jgi:8-oxo-dGTP pyrophosphatase MutT (NUDIX family)